MIDVNKWVLEEALRRDAAMTRARASGPARQSVKAVFKQVGAEVRRIDEKTRTIWHKITSEVRDRRGDIIRIDGLDVEEFKRKPGVLYGHKYDSMNPVPVIGENVGFERSGKDLYAGTKFLDPGQVSPTLGDLVNDCWVLNKKKLLGWSVGIIPFEQKDIVEDGRVTGQEYSRSSLLEYSNVIMPMNQGAVNDAISRGIVSKAVRSFDGSLPRSAGEGPLYYFRQVDESEVPWRRVYAAVKMTEFCQRKLKIPTIELAWYCLCDPRDPGAKVLGPRPTKAFVELAAVPRIWLRGDLKKFELMLAAGHEAKHAWDAMQPKGRFATLDAGDLEAAANAFAFIMFREFQEIFKFGAGD